MSNFAERVDGIGRTLVPDPGRSLAALSTRFATRRPRGARPVWATGLAAAASLLLLALPVAAIFASHRAPGNGRPAGVAAAGSPSPDASPGAPGASPGSLAATAVPGGVPTALPSGFQLQPSFGPGGNPSSAPTAPPTATATQTPANSDCAAADVASSATAAKTSYMTGEPVQMTVSAQNVSSRACVVYVDQCWDWGAVYDTSGNQVWVSPQGGYAACTYSGNSLMGKPTLLQPRESTSLSFTWNQQDCTGDTQTNACAGALVKPGRYDIGGIWRGPRVPTARYRITIG